MAALEREATRCYVRPSVYCHISLRSIEQTQERNWTGERYIYAYGKAEQLIPPSAPRKSERRVQALPRLDQYYIGTHKYQKISPRQLPRDRWIPGGPAKVRYDTMYAASSLTDDFNVT